MVISIPPTIASIIDFMDLGELFHGFFQTIALGSATVFILLGVVRLRSPRRTPALIPGKSSRY